MLANSTGCTKWLVPIIGIPTQALSINPGDASVTGSRVKVTQENKPVFCNCFYSLA